MQLVEGKAQGRRRWRRRPGRPRTRHLRRGGESIRPSIHPSIRPCRCLGPRLGVLLVHLEPVCAPLALPVIPLHLIRASDGTVDAPETMSPETT